MRNIWEHSVKYCQSHRTLLWIWMMSCTRILTDYALKSSQTLVTHLHIELIASRLQARLQGTELKRQHVGEAGVARIKAPVVLELCEQRGEAWRRQIVVVVVVVGIVVTFFFAWWTHHHHVHRKLEPPTDTIIWRGGSTHVSHGAVGGWVCEPHVGICVACCLVSGVMLLQFYSCKRWPQIFKGQATCKLFKLLPWSGRGLSILTKKI